MIRNILLFAGLAIAQDLCTTTLTTPVKCACSPTALHTSTQSIDCNGCGTVATVGNLGIHCDIACQPSTSDYTTTVTSCATSSCTSILTTTAPFGCTITAPPKTVTSSIDCKGCALGTKTTVNPLLGVGPVCVSGRKTVTGSTGEATVTRCLSSPAPSAY